MIQFSKKFRFKETIWPICLPDKAELDQNAYEDIGMVLAAYGPYAEGQLISKCFLGVFKSTKNPTKFFEGLLPLPLKRC